MKTWQLLIFVALLPLVSCQTPAPRDPAAIASTITGPEPLFMCSFNVQFLGSSNLRNNRALAHILSAQGCDLVAIQELVAPPDLTQLPSSPHYKATSPATYPGGSPHKPKENVTDFFMAMHKAGYDGFILSEEDTGRSAKNKTNSTATEWWVTFYRTSKIVPAPDLPHGFLSQKVSANPNWDRVPYAFGFRTVQGEFDFVLISVHLRPGTGPANRKRRAHELAEIAGWIVHQDQSPEKDYVILGDMNIYNEAELAEATPEGFVSLNTDAKFATNTNVKNPYPYDHVMVDPDKTAEIPLENNFVVLNLLELALPFWNSAEPYPGNPDKYNHDKFRFYFSDHHPVGFYIYPTATDAD